eukprot:RCo004305
MFFQSEPTSTPCNMENAEVVEVCVRHGKKRQVEFLERLPGTPEQWVCKAGEQCKMSLKPNKRVKELARLLEEGLLSMEQWAGLMAGLKAETMGYPPVRSAAPSPALYPTAAVQVPPSPAAKAAAASSPPCAPVTTVSLESLEERCPLSASASSVVEETPTKLELNPSMDISMDTITSWADEMDKEFPMMPEGEPTSARSTSSPSTPPPLKQPQPQHPPHRPSTGSSEGPSTAGLLARLSSLEQELSQTKRKLAKATGEMARAVRNEQVMESKFRHLQAEMNRVHPAHTAAHHGLRTLNLTVSVSEPELMGPGGEAFPRLSLGPSVSGAWSAQALEGGGCGMSSQGTTPRSTPLGSALSTPSLRFLSTTPRPGVWPPMYLDSAGSSRRDSGQSLPFPDRTGGRILPPETYSSPASFPRQFSR